MPKKSPYYFLTLFKIEGHEQWRADLSGHQGGFEKVVKLTKTPVTDTKVFQIDRITGDITQI